jgi:putative DNA primase/helicase
MSSIPSDLRSVARQLGGDVVGSQVIAPGPGHGKRDRSLSIRLSATAPEGFLAFSHAGDDFAVCRDHVKRALGVNAGRVGSLGQNWSKEKHETVETCTLCAGFRRPREPGRCTVADDRVGHALALWRESVDPRGTLAERYLASRGLQLGDEVAGNVLRWHARIGAAVALFRNVETNRPQAVTRIYLDSDGNKMRRAFLGPVGGAAIKIDADDAVTSGLHIGEGVETCMAAHQLGLRPCWALGSKRARSPLSPC